MKKTIISIIILILLTGCSKSELPKPEIAEGIRGTFGIDKNINEDTIDNYLNRTDAVYRDMRMLKDPADYEAIGGDSYLSGFIKGFEIFPLPLIVNITNLPEEVGESYQGKTLFTLLEDKTYQANYKESLSYLEYYFPKDKYILIMCGGGGYAGMMKNMLISLGWDKNKIYNVGAYWSYDGINNVNIKNNDSILGYDFWKATYHDIDFDNFNLLK